MAYRKVPLLPVYIRWISPCHWNFTRRMESVGTIYWTTITDITITGSIQLPPLQYGTFTGTRMNDVTAITYTALGSSNKEDR